MAARGGYLRVAAVVGYGLLAGATIYLIFLFLSGLIRDIASMALTTQTGAPLYQSMTNGEYVQLIFLIPILLIICVAFGWKAFKKRFGTNVAITIIAGVLAFFIFDLLLDLLLLGSAPLVEAVGEAPTRPEILEVFLDTIIVLVLGLVVFLLARGSGLAKVLKGL